jgi:hypothetical protein
MLSREVNVLRLEDVRVRRPSSLVADVRRRALVALVAEATSFRRLCEVQLKPSGGRCPVVMQAARGHSVRVSADHI